MEKPFTIRVNDLQADIVKRLNEAKLPCYVLRNILKEIIKAIEDADGEEMTKYFKELQKESENVKESEE